jgi:putative hydrolase of the HAD superfamily
MDSLANAHIVDWSKVDFVLLDMDGTLLDLAFDNYFWRDLLPERYAQLRALSLEAARAELEPKFVAVQHTLPWYCIDHWSTVTGLDVAALKREIRERITPIPGVEAFLKVAQDSGRAMWVVTNAHRDSWQLKLEHTGFNRYFERIFSSHDFGFPKEDLRFWNALHAKQAFDPARALFVDDSMPVLSAAQAWGIAQVIGIRQPDSRLPERPIPGMRSVRTLAELAATID